jgi:gamma-glutamylcyclotransferase (GGCT)/AIG2-like uncharacterized protein YtfP
MSVKFARDALFVYGSLIDDATRTEILGHGVEGIAARLDGFERRRARYFYIARAEGASTRGLVILNLGDEDWRRLDAYEDVPHLYTREDIEVDTDGGRMRCWVYLPTAKCVNP